MLEEAITLMEAYVSAEVRLYLIPKAWKKKESRPGPGRERRAEHLGLDKDAGQQPEGLESLPAKPTG